MDGKAAEPSVGSAMAPSPLCLGVWVAGAFLPLKRNAGELLRFFLWLFPLCNPRFGILRYCMCVCGRATVWSFVGRRWDGRSRAHNGNGNGKSRAHNGDGKQVGWEGARSAIWRASGYCIYCWMVWMGMIIQIHGGMGQYRNSHPVPP